MPKIPAGAVYKPVQQIPDGATYDTPDASKQQLTNIPDQPGLQPASWWEHVKGLAQNAYDSTIPGMVSKAADVGSQYLNAKADERQKANEVAASQGKPAPNSGAATTAMRMGADTAGLVSGASSPTGMATTGAVVAAPVTAGLGLAGMGAYKAFQNRDALANLLTTGEANPDQTREGLNGLAMAVGGAAGAKSSAPASMEGIRRGFNNAAVEGTPTQLLVKATKPNVGLGAYEESLDRTIPDLFAESQKAKAPILNLKGLRDTADAVKNNANAQYQGALGQISTPLDATPIADKMESTIPAIDKFQDPISGIIGKTKAEADLYRNVIPASELDAQRLDANMKLRAAYNKTGGDQAAARSNPSTARDFAIGDGAREVLYPEIKNVTGVDPEKLQLLWGDAQDIGDTAGRRSTVFSRQQPFPMAQQLSDAQAVANGKPGQAILARMFKRFNDSDWLTKEAFDRYGQKPINKPFPYGQFAASMAARGRE